MAYKHDDKTSGQLVRSADWNTMGHAIEDLGNTKLDAAGGAITGDLSVSGKLTAAVAQFTSSLGVTGPANFSGGVTLGGALSVGEIDTTGPVRLGNSDIYFTNTTHNHSGFGNNEGFAAIENTANYDALMILGRAHNSPSLRRTVKLWDYLQVNGDLESTGKISSPRWQATNVMYDRPGAMPVAASLTSHGGTLVVLAAGSGWMGAAGHIGMFINLDGHDVGLARCFTNEPNSHKVFSSNYLVLGGIAAGVHTITLHSWNNTISDLNDFYNVTVLELPF